MTLAARSNCILPALGGKMSAKVKCSSNSGESGESRLKHKRLFTFGLVLFISGVVLLFQPKAAWLRGVSFPCLLC